MTSAYFYIKSVSLIKLPDCTGILCTDCSALRTAIQFLYIYREREQRYLLLSKFPVLIFLNQPAKSSTKR